MPRQRTNLPLNQLRIPPKSFGSVPLIPPRQGLVIYLVMCAWQENLSLVERQLTIVVAHTSASCRASTGRRCDVRL